MEMISIKNNTFGGKQTAMHKDFFDRAKNAVSNGFYLEALVLEYAAIEGRLEVILGILGLPCNKELENKLRKKINISDRINCFETFFKRENDLFKKSKLDQDFFSKKELKQWIDDRNAYTHRLFKEDENYINRKGEAKTLAIKGLEYAEALYNEASRLRRLKNRVPGRNDLGIHICKQNCKACRECPEMCSMKN